MIKLFLLSSAILSLNLITIAQDNLPPVYEISTDTSFHTELPNAYWQMLEDPRGKWTINDVSNSPVSNTFHSNTAKNNQFNYSIHTYWFRFRLKNVKKNEATIGFGDESSEQAEVYAIGKNGKWERFENGSIVPWSILSGFKFFRYIPFVIKPGAELIIYRRLHNGYSLWLSPSKFSIGLMSTTKFIQSADVQYEEQYMSAVNKSLLFGLLLFAGLFSFFFFLIAREQLYLNFSLYVIFEGFGNTYDEFYNVFLREFRVFNAYFLQIVHAFTFFFLTLFIRSLLNTRVYLPRWDKFLFNFNIITFFITLPIFGSGGVTLLRAGLVLEIILFMGILISFFLVLRREKVQNKVLAFAITPAFYIYCLGYSNFLFCNWFNELISIPRFMFSLDKGYQLIQTLCLTWLVIFFSWILLQRFRLLQKQMSSLALEKEKEKTQLIEQQKEELEKTVEVRTSELKHSLEELKSTQSQLIQSEKMASLGELTAGIAHEIQNPLNFVNNFSEVINELIDEMKDELVKGNNEDAIDIANDIKQNLEKITHHGKRADAIVKGMLQHSQSSTGQKEPTDVNKLADEYLRLSYHGLRAKDNSFNAVMKTDFDKSIEKINIIPQDIGRVLLNLYNNAFYAVQQKKMEAASKGLPTFEKLATLYEPTVSVSTKKMGDKIEIRVTDNGYGIPERIVDKIFQPFFTTKPTGQGTGLGLSLSYDIIKAHSGEIKVESAETEGSIFIITLPCSN